MTCPSCFVTTDGKIGLCSQHYSMLRENSYLKFDKSERVKVECIYGVSVVESDYQE